MQGYFPLDIAKRIKDGSNKDKPPHPHQQEAFIALSNTLPTPITGYKGTLLVLPTGGGKTFTSINWICRHILSAGIKVLWMAQTAYLLDQAAKEFDNEIHNATGRQQINMRVVSSSTSHANAGTISTTDDILICTTQTAISAFNAEPLDEQGNVTQTPFRSFIENCKDSQLFVVVDEAHHTPAYGCRTLLWDKFRTTVENLYILGLTATPTHSDKRISGWLKVIFNSGAYQGINGVCYEAKKEDLQQLSILAVPQYIEKQTGMEFEVDDGLFDRLMYKHKDLPENIIEHLATNQGRNNFIIDDYVKNAPEYGKTIIFADRWFQCEYILEKLNAQGIRAGAVYSSISGQNEAYKDGMGRSNNNKRNQEVMDGFRAGKYDVIVNVKMLTEGVDVPDVKTVMITRQTTSNILLTQMIGRALRGKKAGGGKNKDYANIVFFHDTWKRNITWAIADGGTGSDKPDTVRRPPLEWVSIHLVKLAAGDIEFKGLENVPYLTFIPVGFFGCEYTVSISENEEMATFAENIVVYEFNKDGYFKMIEYLKAQELTAYAEEKLTDEQFEEYAERMERQFFDVEKANFDGALKSNIIKIIRHIAQNGAAQDEPPFIDFHERSRYDMDKIATDHIDTPLSQANIILRTMFTDSAMHWQYLYKTFANFKNAFNKAVDSILNPPTPNDGDEQEDESDISLSGMLTDEVKRQIISRDNFTCLCCGKNRKSGKRIRLEVDHILPISMGGKSDITNLQTLCVKCNAVKGRNHINYRRKLTPLANAKKELKIFDKVDSDDERNAIARIVNEFYHCEAMCDLNSHQKRNGQFYSTWEIVLYAGNSPDWIKPYESELLKYVNKQLGVTHVTKIAFRN
jgi:superfamily II DNA or RNA helicase/5S rRNA maturation endonuclease (ribonuclease M5)